MARRRLGVALLISAPVSTEIDGLRRALGSASLGRIPPHLTLISPVNVRDGDLDGGLELIRDVARGLEPILVDLGPVETFHPVTPTLYLAVGGEGLDTVVGLQKALVRAPFDRPAPYDYVPHVTITDNAEPDQIDAVTAAMGAYRATVTFDRLYLLQEMQRPDRSRHWVPLADFPMGGAWVVGRGGLALELTCSTVMPPDGAAALDPPVASSVPHLGAGAATKGDPAGSWDTSAGLVVVGRRDGAVIGVAAGHVVGQRAVLTLIAVAEHGRREGAGSHLLAAFESAAAGRGCTDAETVSPEDAPVLALLARRGWTLVERGGRVALGEHRLHRRL